MTFGECFRAMRESHNLSRVKLARVIGCSVSAMCSWEEDRYLPNPQNLDKLIATLPWTEIQQLKGVNMSNKKTYVAFVLDESGSMWNLKAQAVSSFNEQLDAVRDNGALGGDTYVCVYSLGGEIELKRPLVSYTAIERLTEEEYNPHGWTPLYDAVGTAITMLETAMAKEIGDDIAALVIVITDGEENTSKEYTSKVLGAKIAALQDSKKWTFAFLGTTLKQAMAAQNLGISVGSTSTSDIASMGSVTLASTPVASYMTSRGEGRTYVPDYFGSPDSTVTKTDE